MTTRPQTRVQRVGHYLALPTAITPFEATYLRRINRIALWFFVAHVPAMVLVAWANGTQPWLAFALTTAVVAGPAVAYRTLSNPRAISVTYGVAAMFMGGLLVHFGQGPVQIEMHFYFFALLAMLAVFGNPAVILAAAVTVALHHFTLWVYLPASVFNYDAPFWVVGIHTGFVVLEAVAACFIARSFFDNVIGLSEIVDARTAQLARRNADMRLVLDNVAQGFVTIDRRGVPSPECSRAFERTFGSRDVERAPGSRDVGETLFDRFGVKSPEFAEMSRVSWGEVTDGVMPLALTLEQMPRDLATDEGNFRAAYIPIGEGETPDRFLVVVTDVTAEVRQLRAESHLREEMRLFERVMTNRSVVKGFFGEGTELVAAITSGHVEDMIELKRMLHTLKGNSALCGLDSVAALCHDLETQVAERNEYPPSKELAKLRDRWSSLSANLERLTGARHGVVEVDEPQLRALEAAVRRGASTTAILAMVRGLELEATHAHLAHFAAQARGIAERLGKSLEVRIEGGDLRLDPRHWASFWSAFNHTVRNAVDHGLESSGERASYGKSPIGIVTLRTVVRDERFVVEIADDGRGIDWDALARNAEARGIAAGTPEKVQAALFRQGVSTAVEVTDLSGRGIGLGAVQAATQQLGGRLEIQSARGLGTTLRMTFPKGAMFPESKPPLLSTSTMATLGA